MRVVLYYGCTRHNALLLCWWILIRLCAVLYYCCARYYVLGGSFVGCALRKNSPPKVKMPILTIIVDKKQDTSK